MFGLEALPNIYVNAIFARMHVVKCYMCGVFLLLSKEQGHKGYGLDSLL